MLPGIRFLFAAFVLSMSLLVFGFGATALLRSAHQEVSSLPIRRTPPETVFTQPAETSPRLAMLRLDVPAPPAEPSIVTPSAPVDIAPAMAALTDSDKVAEPEKLAVLAPIESPEPVALPQSETAQPEAEAAKPDTPPAPEAAVTVAAAPPALAKTEPAPGAAPVAVPAVETTTAAPRLETPAPTDPGSASMQIATLGGPAVSIAPAKVVKPPVAAATATKAERKRTIQRRREAAREAQKAQAAREARAARDAQAAAQQASPFATLPQR
jgi:hypothetical protein